MKKAVIPVILASLAFMLFSTYAADNGESIESIEKAFGETVDTSSLAPSFVTLDVKKMKPSDIVKEIEKQTGNKIKLGKNFKDTELKDFKLDKVGFWQAIDKLGEVSGNVYAKEACSGFG